MVEAQAKGGDIGCAKTHVVGACGIIHRVGIEVPRAIAVSQLILVEGYVVLIALTDEVVAKPYCKLIDGLHLYAGLYGMLSPEGILGVVIHKEVFVAGKRSVITVVGPFGIAHAGLCHIGILVLHAPGQYPVNRRAQADASLPRRADGVFYIAGYVLAFIQMIECFVLQSIPCGGLHRKAYAEGILLNGANNKSQLSVYTIAADFSFVIQAVVQAAVGRPFAIFAPCVVVGVVEAERCSRVEAVAHVERNIEVKGPHVTALVAVKGIFNRAVSVTVYIVCILGQIIVIQRCIIKVGSLDQPCKIVVRHKVVGNHLSYLVQLREASEIHVVGIEALVIVGFFLVIKGEVDEIQLPIGLEAPHESHLVEAGPCQFLAIGASVAAVPAI